jgi:hypothetical protein
MEWLIALLLLGVLVYLVADTLMPTKKPLALAPRKRLCDYYAQGSVYEDIADALSRGIRLIEVHVYSDEQDEPVIAKRPLQDGYDYAYDNYAFEQACIALANKAFPSPDPLIFSIVPHTTKVTTLNRMAYHLQTTLHKHMIPDKDVHVKSIGDLADKIVIASGGNIAGTDLDELVNLNWDGASLRRLNYTQAVFPRDQKELVAYNRDAISLVAPEAVFSKITVNPSTSRLNGCQWNLFPNSAAPAGFVEKPAGLQ